MLLEDRVVVVVVGLLFPHRWPQRAGPRIFIGKLSKDTTEADVKEYFMRFGYVMDVYLPKAKDNKMVSI